MTKFHTPTWFDRYNRYRIATIFLYMLFLLTTWGLISGHSVKDWIPVWGTRALFWAGLFVQTVALAMDAYEVYAGKRKVKHLIKEQRQRTRLEKIDRET